MGSDYSLIKTTAVNKCKLEAFTLHNPINLVGFTNELAAKVTVAVKTTLKVDSVQSVITLCY